MSKARNELQIKCVEFKNTLYDNPLGDEDFNRRRTAEFIFGKIVLGLNRLDRFLGRVPLILLEARVRDGRLASRLFWR